MTLGEMLREHNYKEIWEKYCGFINLDINEYELIQERLLLEQIELLWNCDLGKKIIGNIKPKNIKEFRKYVPLTTYDDYADVLLNKREDMLPEKPAYWIQTTWKGGQHPIKMAPYPENMIDEYRKSFLACVILATSKEKEEFSLQNNDKFLYGMAPLPYLTGLAPYAMEKEINFDYLPSIEEAESVSFEMRNKMGFKEGMEKGIDLFFGVSSVLVRMGESFVSGESKSKGHFNLNMNFKMASKLFAAFLKKKLFKKEILPKDIWSIKGIICAGTDTAVYKDKIEHYWGKRPVEIYGGTEIAIAATETLDGDGLQLFPDINFVEFIPEKEALKSYEDSSFVPKTVLLKDIKKGQRYEFVITSLRGGAFVRYRVGDIVECTLSSDDGKAVPKIRFIDRISNIIDLAGFTRITQTTIHKALELTNLSVAGWFATKEYISKEPVLHIYIEVEGEMTPLEIKTLISDKLKIVDSDFKDVERMLKREVMKLTVLKKDSFDMLKKEGIIQKNVINPDHEVIKKLTMVG